MPKGEAIAAVMELRRRPALARLLRQREIPQGIEEVIRIAAGSEVDTAHFVQQVGVSAEQLREACKSYLLQILFHPSADEYRLLGLQRTATLQQVGEHKRILLKWLHPDVNKDPWERALFQKVGDAASRLSERLQAGTPVAAREPARLSSRQHSDDHRRQRAARIASLAAGRTITRHPQKTGWSLRKSLRWAIVAAVVAIGCGAIISLPQLGSPRDVQLSSMLSRLFQW